MFRYSQKVFRNYQENGTNGTERLARIRESEHCSVPIPVPFRALSVPICVLSLIGRLATGWPLSSAWWVLRYELAEHRPARPRISGVPA